MVSVVVKCSEGQRLFNGWKIMQVSESVVTEGSVLLSWNEKMQLKVIAGRSSNLGDESLTHAAFTHRSFHKTVLMTGQRSIFSILEGAMDRWLLAISETGLRRIGASLAMPDAAFTINNVNLHPNCDGYSNVYSTSQI
jgi:hypothetical protein